jgi:hypothetical protein
MSFKANVYSKKLEIIIIIIIIDLVMCDVMCTVYDAMSRLHTHGRRSYAQCLIDGVNDLDVYILSRL